MDQPQPATQHTVLVVEDEAPMRKMLVGVLQQAGYVVIEATNGREGLQIALAQHPAIIVTDNIMPIMEGVEMVAQIRTDKTWGSRVPVIVMTNVNSMEALNKSLQAGGIDYLMKADVQLEQIVALVKQRIGGV